MGKENDRKALYGTIYSGLHYNHDLAQLWNAENLKSIKSSELSTLAPAGWDSTVQDGFFILIYKGQQPAQALDELVKGPTVIDCGMFTQLSIWFGIRYMLGNERFNEYFGRAPFFITQIVYHSIEESNKPYSGNPLYSFLSKKELVEIPSVTVKHLKNTPLYPLKHPGGNAGGQNCIVIGEQYYIFDPHLENTQGMTETSVMKLLHDAFNEGRQPYELDRLALYAATPEKYHSKFFFTYGQLIDMAENLRDQTFTEEEFSQVKQNSALELAFDLPEFSIWLKRMENPRQSDYIDYLPQSIDHSLLPVELLNVIPFENRTSMDFSSFKQETPQQKELIKMAMQFCQSIMAGASNLLILTGKAGVGKTASAVCAAKELTAKGKKVAWISEVMVKGWTDQAKSFAAVDSGLEIDNLLAKDPDVVFLDDDNLAGFSGNLLLEKVYAWYVLNPAKGLFITSNEPIQFKNCYGYQLDGQYHYPPFNDYSSLQYLHWHHKADLAGESLRSRREGQSIGAIVSDSAWKANEERLGRVELIPAFDEEEELVPIRQSLYQTGSPNCSAYQKLRPVQQQWLDIYHVCGGYISTNNGRPGYEQPHFTANPLKFEKTTCKTIVLEMGEYNSSFFGKEIDSDSMEQLIRVLNYAHDQGGRRVILINQTSYSKEQLLTQIKAQLPKSERERTWSRLMLLLCETEDSIFKYEQFNGQVGIAVPKRTTLPDGNVQGLKQAFFSTTPSFFSREKPSVKPLQSKQIFTEKSRDFLIENRHNNAELQHEYDKQFGLILK